RPIVWAKLFTPDASWYLFVAAYDRQPRRIHCYAILNYDLQVAEWGWQYLDDLEAFRGPMRLPMERDTSFTPKTLEEALKEFKQERGLDAAPDSLPTEADQPGSSVDAMPALEVPEPDVSPVPEPPEKQPDLIRIIKPQGVPPEGSEPDDIQKAV